MECLHHSLKVSLKALQNTNNWTDALPMVLLGMRTAVKDDLKCTSAEFMYGTTLMLPGKFFTPHTSSSLPDPVIYAMHLKDTMSRLCTQPTRQQRPRQVLSRLTCLLLLMRSFVMILFASLCSDHMMALFNHQTFWQALHFISYWAKRGCLFGLPNTSIPGRFSYT